MLAILITNVNLKSITFKSLIISDMKQQQLVTHLRDEWPSMLLHIGNGSSLLCSASSNSDRAGSIYYFAAAVAILEWNKMLTELPVMSIGINRFVFVVTGYRPHMVLH
jgi:hypothetical protein